MASLVNSITHMKVATMNIVVLILYIFPVTVGDLMKSNIITARAANSPTPKVAICPTVRYLSIMVRVLLVIRISIAENGVILKPSTTLFVIPKASHIIVMKQ